MAARTPVQTLARALTNVLNPFAIFTVLYAFVAFSETGFLDALLYVLLELFAAAAVAGFVLLMRRRSQVGAFWLPARAERLTPALFLLAAFVALLLTMRLTNAPDALLLLTLSMGLASAVVAGLTLFFKASAHCTVAGHAATAGLLTLGPAGALFLLVLPAVLWSRVALKAHTLPETFAGVVIGVGFALLFLA